MERNLTKIQDVDLHIISKLDDESLLNFSTVSKYCNFLSKNEHFWRKRLIDKFGKKSIFFKSPNRTFREFYWKIVSYIDRYIIGDNVICELASEGKQNLDLINFFIDDDYTDLDFGLYGAASGGHYDLVDFFISKGVYNWDFAIQGAILGKQKHIIDFFLSFGITKVNNWNLYMLTAVKNEDINLVKFFITKGANDWQKGWLYSNMIGHKKLTKLFNKKLCKNSLKKNI